MKKSDPKHPQNRLVIPRAWRDSVVEQAFGQIKKRHALDERTQAVVRARVVRLCDMMSFHFTNADYAKIAQEVGPFSATDAAALVIFRRGSAFKIARILFGARLAELYFGADTRINMDWFDFDLP